MTARERDALRRAGEASVLILVSLADGPKHGYALIQDVKQFAGVELGPGTLYGALDRLERLGLIEPLPADERRHPYRITAPGAAALRVHLDSLERVSAAGRLRLQLGGHLMSAPTARKCRLVSAALRCYPARWRRRHEAEAAELAALLIRDGNPAVSIAWNYLVGAARERLTPAPGRTLSTVTAALLAATCLLGFAAALVAETMPARAAGTTQSPSSPVPPQVRPASVGPSAACPLTPRRPAGPRRPVPGAIPAVSHSQLSIRRTARARAC